MTFRDDLPTAEDANTQPPVTPRRSRDPLALPEAEALVRRVADLIASAKPLPMSSTVRINRDEVLDLLGEAIDRLPDELSQARHLLKEREEFLERVRDEGDEILDLARSKAESMVRRTEVVKAAELRAKHIVKDADDEARRLRHESEDFCDKRLAQFEVILERTTKMVQAGRAKLHGTPLTPPEGPPAEGAGQVQEGPDADQSLTGAMPPSPAVQPPQAPLAPPAQPSLDDAFFDQDQG